MMMIPVLLFSIIQIAHCLCPDGFELVTEGECRGEYMNNVHSFYDQVAQTATSICSEIDGYAPIIHNEEQNAYWLARKNVLHDRFVLGLVCNTSSMKYEWADGSAIDYKPPAGKYNSSLDGSCSSKCGWYMFLTESLHGEWDVACGQTNVDTDIYCVKQLHQPVLLDESCQKFEDDSEDGVCYQVGASAENWKDAQMTCRKLGANLASIHNPQENSFIRRLAVSKGAVNGVFLGATISGKGDNYGWIDGSAWDYDNFFSGFPKSDFGDCVAMDTTTTAGQWMNIDCTAKLPVACIRPNKEVQPNLNCSNATYKEGEIITSPGFPFSASTPCDFFIEVDIGKRVELEIILLEANSCCDKLIIYNGYLGGKVMENLTGEMRNETYTTTTSNIMRVTWEPEGGVNVMGVAMTFRGV